MKGIKKYQVSVEYNNLAEILDVKKGYEGLRAFDKQFKAFYFWDKTKNKFVAETTGNMSNITELSPLDGNDEPINSYIGDRAGVIFETVDAEENFILLQITRWNKTNEDEDREIGNQYTFTIDNSTGDISRELHLELVGFDLTLYLATDENGDLDDTINILENILEIDNDNYFLTGELDFRMLGAGSPNTILNEGLEQTQFSGGGDNYVEGTPGSLGKMLYSTVNEKIYIYTDRWVFFIYTEVGQE